MNLNYPFIEYVYRFLWWLVWPMFRLSPRVFYGWRKFLLIIFGAKLGKEFRIFPSSEVTFPWKLVVGDNVTISWGVKLYNLGQIVIHDNVVISQYCHLCAGTHDYESAKFDLIKSTVVIESNVWLAADVFIGPNVTIAERSVIGARSVVFRDTEANGIYIGNPAKLIKYR